MVDSISTVTATILTVGFRGLPLVLQEFIKITTASFQTLLSSVIIVLFNTAQPETSN
jgi:hypothetical protein